MSTPEHVFTGRSVPLDTIVLEAPINDGTTWTNIREFSGLGRDAIEAFGKRVKIHGITSPLLVQQVRIDGKIYNLTIDGQRRFMGASLVLPKGTLIPVVDLTEGVIEELTPELAESLTIKALTSLDREEISSYEISTVAERMKSGKKTLEQIGAIIGRDASWVSKILKARTNASPKLLQRWKSGAVTDEQFKELAAEKDVSAQEEATEKVVQARTSGDKAEARVLSKELKEKATITKQTAKAASASEGKVKHPAALVPREQKELFQDEPRDRAREVKPPSKIVLEQFLALAAKKPPTSETVKGIFLGVRYAMGLVNEGAFGKAFDQYVARLEGKPRPAKKTKVKAAKIARPKKAAKKAKPAKKARKR